MIILKIIKKSQLKKRINRARISHEILKKEIKPYDWTKFYD